MTNKKGQTMIFWIIAIVIVAGIGVYFIASDSVSTGKVPISLQEVYTYYDGCITQDLKDAVDLAGVQGGRINSGTYIPGSDYSPFSSHLNFMGFGVPYWYYISANGVTKNNVPSKSELENEIENYIENNANKCDFSAFYERGFEIELGKPSASVKIESSSVSVSLNAGLAISKGNERTVVNSKQFQIQSSLGELFDEALNFYNREMTEAFLENYSNDVLRLYAPVDGVLIQCSPQIWKTGNIVSDLQQGLETNLARIKFGDKKSAVGDLKYYTMDYSTNKDIKLLYSRNWPQKIEINGDGVSQSSIVAEPIGNQQGLGIMGFCYVPYHYVYDLSFPVMVQIMNGDEIFQFPMAVIIDKNMPRKAATVAEEEQPIDVDVCAYPIQNMKVNIKDNKFNSIDGSVYYSCLGQECFLGESKGGIFEGGAPACINGFLRIQSEGYADSETMMSTNNELAEKEVFLDKLYNVSVNVLVDGKTPKGMVLVSFEGNRSVSVTPPENSNAELSEGVYNVKVYVYGNSTLKIPASNKQECISVAKSGIAGLFGATEDRCFNINIPETSVDSALIAGGTISDYFFEDQLSKGTLTLSMNSLPTPNTIEQLQNNYVLFDSNDVVVDFA